MKKFIAFPKGKGGVGTTLLASALTELMRYNCPDLKVAAADGDEDVGEFFFRLSSRNSDGRPSPEQSPISGAKKFAFTRTTDITQFSELISEEYDILLMDLPAGSIHRFQQLTSSITSREFMDEISGLSIEITIVMTMTPMISSLYALSDAMRIFGNDVQFVVAKNMFFGRPQDFLFWNKDARLSDNGGEHISNQFKRLGGIEIDMPVLPSDTFSLIDAYRLSILGGVTHPRLRWADHANLRGWLRSLIAAITPAAPALGIANIEEWKVP